MMIWKNIMKSSNLSAICLIPVNSSVYLRFFRSYSDRTVGEDCTRRGCWRTYCYPSTSNATAQNFARKDLYSDFRGRCSGAIIFAWLFRHQCTFDLSTIVTTNDVDVTGKRPARKHADCVAGQSRKRYYWQKKLKKWVVSCREMVKLLTPHAQVKHKAFHLVKRRLDQIFESIQCRSEDEKKLLRQLVFFDGKVSCLHGSGTNVEFSHQSLKTHVLHFVGAGIVVCTNQCCHKHQFALQIVRLVPRRIVFWRNWRWHACCSAQRCSVPIERR